MRNTERIASTAERLRVAMLDKGIKQADLSVKSGIDRGALSSYLSGRYEPKQLAINKLAIALDVQEMWLWGYDVPKERAPESADSIFPIPKMNKIPLLGTIACGTPILAEQNIEDDVDLPAHIRADFALRCKGDSMINARIFDGDIVYIRKQETVDNGEIAAVLIDHEATLKRVQLFPDHITLEPENPLIRPISIWGEEMNTVCILGKAVAFTSCVR